MEQKREQRMLCVSAELGGRAKRIEVTLTRLELATLE